MFLARLFLCNIELDLCAKVEISFYRIGKHIVNNLEKDNRVIFKTRNNLILLTFASSIFLFTGCAQIQGSGPIADWAREKQLNYEIDQIKKDQKEKQEARLDKPVVSEQCKDFIAGKVGGTVIGTGLGAVIGKQVGGGTKGAVIGGLIGGAAGYFIGSAIDERRQELCLVSQKTNTKIIMGDITSDAIEADSSTKKVEADVVALPDIKFKTGSAELDDKQKNILKEYAKVYAKKDSDKKILIIGNTDETGTVAENQKLSEARAKAVAEIYKAEGIPEENLYYQGAGSSMPIASNNTNDGKKLNQRTEIVAFKNEEHLAKAVQNRKPNPAIFNTTKNSTNQKDTKESKKKQAKVATKQTITVAADQFDLGGTSGDNSKSLGVYIGNLKKQNSWIPSFITPVYASSETDMLYRKSCRFDTFKPVYDVSTVKKLSNNKTLNYKTSEYYNGLNESVWIAQNVNNNLVSVQPMAVLRSGAKPVREPQISIWKNYSQEKKPIADINIKTHVNTYEGENGLLFRMFNADSNSNLICSDMYISKDGKSGKQQIYYRKNGNIYVSETESKKLTKE
jgi:outer membrane protein OmpA-like peptidoglycan-associated protein